MIKNGEITGYYKGVPIRKGQKHPANMLKKEFEEAQVKLK